MKKFLLSLAMIASSLATGIAQHGVILDFEHASIWTATAEGDSIRTDSKKGWGTTETTIATIEQPTGFYGIDVTFKATDNAYFICSKTDTAFFLGSKNGGKGAYMILPDVDFRVGTIEVKFSNNVSTSVKPDFFVGETAFGQVPATVTKGGTATWTVPEELSAVGTVYVLKTTTAVNLQVATITMWEYAAPEVNAPVISPVSGVYPTAQTVTISADAGCSIYYTLDGTDPTDASTAYTAPFVVSTTTTVKAIAYNEEDCGSAITESKIEIGYLGAYFKKDQQGWTIDDKNVPAGKAVWVQDSRYGMKATGYIGGSAQETESWLVSPTVDLSAATNPVLTISHAANYFTASNPIDECVSILVAAEGGAWEALEVSNWPNSFTYVTSNISLQKYAGKKVQLAIRYTSTSAAAGTYETESVKVAEGEVVEYVHIANTQETAYTTAKAKELIDNPLSILSDVVFVQGIVSKVDTIAKDGSLTYWLDNNAFEAYKGLALEGAQFTEETKLQMGDSVVIKGNLSKHNSTYELAAGNVLVFCKKNEKELIDPTNDAQSAYTVAQCINMIQKATEYDLSKPVYLKGVVTFVESCKNNNITFTIRDTATSADSLQVFRARGLENEDVKSKDYVKVGDEVVVYDKITFYAAKSLYETAGSGYIYSRNGVISALDALKEDENASAELFNILGQKVESMDSKGIYIVNGKKVIVR